MTPERRTNAPRRRDDTATEVAVWIAPLIKHWSVVLAIGTAVGALVTLVGTAYAMRFTNPTREVREVAREMREVRVAVDSVVLPRLVRVEDGVATGSEERQALIWMTCDARKRTTPDAYMPKLCTTGARP